MIVCDTKFLREFIFMDCQLFVIFAIRTDNLVFLAGN